MRDRDRELREAATNAAKEIILANSTAMAEQLHGSCEHHAHLAQLLLALVGWDERDLHMQLRRRNSRTHLHD